MIKNRYEQLDSLRGIASSQVFLLHLLSISSVFFASNYWGVPSPSAMFQSSKAAFAVTYTPLAFIKSGHEAVVFFFILSGFVLSGTLFNRVDYTTFKQYLIKRIFRLWVPFIIVILFSIVLRSIFYNYDLEKNAGISSWFKQMWSHQISVAEFLRFLYLSGNTHNADTTLWSLIIEIKISILLPFFILIMDRLKGYQDFIFLILIMIISRLSYFILSDNLNAIYGARDLHFLSPFILGAYLNKYLAFWVDKISGYSKKRLIVSMLVLIVLYSIDSTKYLLASVPVLYKIISKITYEIQMFSSIAFVLLSFHTFFQKKLLHSVYLKLGQISYSLYLIHPLLLLAFTYSLFKSLKLYEIWLLLIPTSLFISYLFYKYIETPVNNFGRNLAQKTNPKKNVVVAESTSTGL